MKTLVIGYGNDSRNDDGAGRFVIAELAKLGLPEVTLETAHQLEVELAETVTHYDRVISLTQPYRMRPHRFSVRS